jgi:hypothetical protein
MDDMNRWSPRMLACLFALLGAFHAGAKTPEPMPMYAVATQLREDATLCAVAFGSPQADGESIGIACGDRGAILRSEDGGQSWLPLESGVDCRLEDVIWISPQRVVVVGGGYDRITRISRGAVLYSNDAGQHWQRAADEELPKLNTVRMREDSSLVATCDWSHSLLTRQLESHDGGRTWKNGGQFESQATATRPPTSSELNRWVAATGLPVRVRDACRMNHSEVCAVGDHGVILLSTDRGKSWRTVRGENRRTGILFVANHPASVPWSQLGNEAIENRNRVSLLLHQGSDPDVDPASDPAQTDKDLAIDLASQVAVMLGGSGAELIATSDSTLTRAAMEWLAIHRPAALVMDRTLPANVHDAFYQAATASGVHRVVVYSFDGSGHITLHRNALLPKSGVLASDLLADAMHFVAPHRRGNSSISLRYLYDAAPAARRGDSVVDGVPLESGQRLAVPIQQASRRQLQIVQARLKQSELTANLIRTSRTSNQFAESLRSTLDQTAKDDQFRLAWSILLESTAKPVSGFREVVLDELAARFPARSAGRWAKLRRESIRHSMEWQRLRSRLDDAPIKTAGVPAAETVQVSPFQVSPTGVHQVSALSPVVVPKPELHNFTPQADEQVEVDLTWEFHPLVLISREAARSRGDDGQLQVAGDESANLKRLAGARDNAWSALLSTNGRQVIIARRAAAPPKLDGIIDDHCWQSALSSAGHRPRLRIAYDADYVYIAAECRGDQLRPDTLASESQTTFRDYDLTSVDRMRVSIDTDRDLMTAMQLSVSDGGRTHDAIDGNPRWQPTWYVDARREDDKVTFEMAILRRDVVDLPITAGESWFVMATPIRADSAKHETSVPTPRQWMRVIFRP